MWLSDKSMGIITIAITISLVAIVIVVVGGSVIIMPPINAQQNLISSSQSKNTTSNIADTKEKTYILNLDRGQ